LVNNKLQPNETSPRFIARLLERCQLRFFSQVVVDKAVIRGKGDGLQRVGGRSLFAGVIFALADLEREGDENKSYRPADYSDYKEA
jgi:hypothetical protein